MTKEKQRWLKEIKEKDLNHYRCTVRMVTDSFIEDYDDIDMDYTGFRTKDIAKIVTGFDIISVKNDMFSY